MIQQGVSAGESSDGNGMSIGRIMDYIEARLDAIKSREEEEDEDEEKDKERDRRAPAGALSKVPSGAALNAKSPSATTTVTSKQKDHVRRRIFLRSDLFLILLRYRRLLFR